LGLGFAVRAGSRVRFELRVGLGWVAAGARLLPATPREVGDDHLVRLRVRLGARVGVELRGWG
jgi:hypothetical protein